MALFTVAEDKCRKDGLCAAVCPYGLISLWQALIFYLGMANHHGPGEIMACREL